MVQFFGAILCELERESVWKAPPKHRTRKDTMEHVPVLGTDGKLLGKVLVQFEPVYHLVNSRYDRVKDATMQHLNETVSKLLRHYDSLVVVANIGLHYIDPPKKSRDRGGNYNRADKGFTREDYGSAIVRIGQALATRRAVALQQGKKMRLFWRESSAQHFPTPTGYWPGVRYVAGVPVRCQPIQDRFNDWRNIDLHGLFHKHTLAAPVLPGEAVREIFSGLPWEIVPFYNITFTMHNEHVNGRLRDCTHFCWTPMMHQSLFEQLSASMQW
jgi:hypothetical protein